MQNPNHRGAISEAAIAYEAVKCGVDVMRPVSEHCRYDLVFGLGPHLLRVQCKSAALSGEVVIIRLVSSWRGPAGYVRNPYKPGEIDLVAAHCPELNRSFLLNKELARESQGSSYGFRSPATARGRQYTLPPNHEFSGAIAQLGERLHGMQEVAGSSPASSTPSPGATTIGAHELRERFGFWMERANAGEES